MVASDDAPIVKIILVHRSGAQETFEIGKRVTPDELTPVGLIVRQAVTDIQNSILPRTLTFTLAVKAGDVKASSKADTAVN